VDEGFDIGLIDLIQFSKDTNFSSVIECENQKNPYPLTKNLRYNQSLQRVNFQSFNGGI
jgi:hypothetical protein